MRNTMTEPKYIQFVFKGYSSSGKTKVWSVAIKEDEEDCIGEIRWYAHWRCYSFHPYEKTVYEKTCLRDIANFCEKQTKLHKKK